MKLLKTSLLNSRTTYFKVGLRLYLMDLVHFSPFFKLPSQKEFQIFLKNKKTDPCSQPHRTGISLYAKLLMETIANQLKRITYQKR